MKYCPSNGTEGDCFQEDFCVRSLWKTRKKFIWMNCRKIKAATKTKILNVGSYAQGKRHEPFRNL